MREGGKENLGIPETQRFDKEGRQLMIVCLYDKSVMCGNKIKSKRDCNGCECKEEYLYDLRQKRTKATS